MNESDFRDLLNKEQFMAATAPDGPLLVLAAAGTGKTRTLVYRMAWLVNQGVPADRILLLTFTNKAAREMLERAREIIGTGVAGLWGGTFHHMANRILRRYGQHLGYRSDFAILDRDDARTIVGNCIKDFKFSSKDFPRKDVLLSLFSAGTNGKQSVEDLVFDRFDGHAVDPADVMRVHSAYVQKKRDLGAMDFDDLLLKCLQLFQEQPRVLEQYQERFLHVLVDEYQDTNPIQAQMVDSVASRNRNVFVVGDDFQSIYSWRGADFRNIMTFPDRYADAQVYKLETNYRSVPEVLEVANACIAGNPEQFQKRLRATREPYRRPAVARVRDGFDQARFVVNLVGQFQREGYQASDIAILYRAHFHALEVQLELARERVPHVITSGMRFFEQKHIKDVCSVVKLVASPADEMAFTRLLELMVGVGPRTVVKIWGKLGGRFNAMDAQHVKTVNDALRAPAKKQWEAVVPVLTDYLGERTGRDAGEIIARFLDVFYGDYANNSFDNYDRRVDDIKELVLHAGRCETLELFLSDMALLTNVDTEGDQDAVGDSDAIRLSTVHQAKGLEWPVVIILWASDGMFPSSRSIEESEEGESEERRLFYVAVTRAKDELVICTPEVRRMRDGGILYQDPSRFVREIPPKLLRRMSS